MSRPLARWSLLLMLIPAPLAARAEGRAVVFEDGRTLRVEAVRVDGAFAVLSLEGGGLLSVPMRRIVSLDELPVDPAAVDAGAQGAGEGSPWREAAGAYADLIGEAAQRHDLDPALLTAMATVESALDPRAVSPKGACGLLQLMPATARRFGVDDVFDAAQNVEGGARYLSWLLERFDGQTELALAGYNAGEGAVDRHRGVPPYRETLAYVSRVLGGVGRLTPLAP